MQSEKFYTIGNAGCPIEYPLVQMVKDYEEALCTIEEFGHSHGHGHGYTCANIAEKVLKKYDHFGVK